MSLAVTSALPETSALHTSMLLLPPKQVVKCRGVQLLKEQNIRSKYMRHNTTQNQQRIFINSAGVGTIPGVSRVNGGVARQQQLGDFNVTILGGAMQGSGIAEGTGDQGQIAEAQYKEKSAMHVKQQCRCKDDTCSFGR